MIRRGCIERTIEGNTMSEFITRSRAYAIAAPLLIFSPNANAQPAAITRNVTAANATQEIVVTAQRREERLQDDPISRPEDHTSELQQLMLKAYAVFGWQQKSHNRD